MTAGATRKLLEERMDRLIGDLQRMANLLRQVVAILEQMEQEIARVRGQLGDVVTQVLDEPKTGGET